MKASDNVFPKVMLSEEAEPATPDAGEVVVYAKADGKLYVKDDTGTETDLAATGSGIAATLLDAEGDLIMASAADTAARLARGTDGQVLRSTSSTVGWEDDLASVNFIMDGSGSAITTGLKGYVRVPFACTITAVTMLADQSTTTAVDVWKDTLANYPPVDADSITASAVPTITADTDSTDTTLTGWTTTVAAGDVLAFNVDSNDNAELLTVILTVRKT